MKRVGAASFSVAAFAVVTVVAVGMTTPASALDETDVSMQRATGTLTLAARDTGGGDAEQYVIVDDTGTDFTSPAGAQTAVARGGYSVAMVQAAPAPKKTVIISTNAVRLLSPNESGVGSAAAGTGYNPNGWGSNPSPIPAGFSNVSNKWFVNDPGGAVQWPFVVGCPITYGFGWRPGEFHEGADFTPGAGAPIQAIANGVVRVAQANYYGYGTAVVIDHVINGQAIASLYAHLEPGSMRVSVGEQVSVGQVIGQVGTSGDTVGANMHFQIMVNDNTPIDPVAWLRANAGP